MAVEIPVYVDILGGIDDAIKNQLPKGVKEMQVAVSRNALQLKLKIDYDGTRMTLKRILDDTTISAKQLSIALEDVNEKIAKRIAGGGFKGKNGRYTSSERSLLEAKRVLEARQQILEQAQAVEKATKQEEKLAETQDKVVDSNKKIEESSKDVNKQLTSTNNKLATIIKNTIRLIALHSATRFIKNIREVTAEFEMQRVALAGIIQDTAQAESLFKQIKAAAIQSPFEIKELVSFTKQLSAYRIETDKLFDTTMKLADVSAGLGVDMNRLVLAYGQVRAAAVLRGQELRQFTEAGIPLVELLADKFTKLNGRMVSTAEVFELISKRAVPFKMIEEIFNDMTDAGGMFYKMQEKQSETLKGQWMKLKDALSIMYDEMGNTKPIHSAMESLMTDAMQLIQNWRKIAGIIKGAGVALGIVEVISVFIPKFTKNTTLARKAWVGLVNSFKSAGTWIGIAATAIASLIGYLIAVRKEAQRLNKEITEARLKGDIQIDQSIRNFKRLADAAVSAASGSAEQRDALKELLRTYGDIIPEEDLQINKLRELKGNYDLLTEAIRQKIQMQIHEQNINQIEENYGNKLAVIQRSLKDLLIENAGLSSEEAGRVLSGIIEAIKKGEITIGLAAQKKIGESSALSNILQRIITEQVGDIDTTLADRILRYSQTLFGTKTYLTQMVEYHSELNAQLEDEENYFNGLNNQMGRYADVLKKLRKDSERVPEGFTLEQVGTFEYNQALWKQRLNDYKKTLTDVFKELNVDISEAFATADVINFEKITDQISVEKGTEKLKKFVNELQKDYLKFAPQENTTRLVTQAAVKFADEVGIAMSKVQGYLKQDGKKMDEYAKAVEGFVEAQKLRVQTLEFERKNWEVKPGVADYVRPTDKDIQNEKDELSFLEKLLEFVKEFLKQKGRGGGSAQDPWIILYKNRMKFMQDFQKGVQDLNQYLTTTDALIKEQGIMKGRGLSLGIKTEDLLGTPQELRNWYDKAIKDVVAKIKSMGGREFAGLGVTEILAKDLKGRKLQKYQELLQELWKGLTDFDTKQLKDEFDKKLARISEEIKRSETARNFYKDIFDMTGSEELATSLTASVYGNIGADFKDRLQQELNEIFEGITIDEGMREAISKQDFDYIFANLPEGLDKYRKKLVELRDAQQKFSADQIKTWMNELKQAKTYGDERVRIARTTQERIAEINRSNLPDEEKKSLIAQYVERESKEIAKLQYEAFKDSPMYIALFEDLDAASGRMLDNMRKRLVSLRGQWSSLDPVQLKEMQKRMEEIDSSMARRNPFKALSKSIKEYQALLASGRTRKGDEEAAVSAEQNRQTAETNLELALKDLAVKKAAHEQSLKQNGADSTTTTLLSGQMKAANALVDARRKEADAATKSANQAQENANQWSRLSSSVMKSVEAMSTFSVAVQALKKNVHDIVDLFAEMSGSEGLSEAADLLESMAEAAGNAASGLARVMAGDISGAGDLLSAKMIGIQLILQAVNMINNAQLRDWDRQMEEQEKTLARLQRSYDKLGEAMENAFGSDYLYNYNEQLKNLAAQREAYTKQLQIQQEKSREASRDEDRKAAADDAENLKKRISEVEKQAKDVTQSMQEFFAGTDLSSAAEEFANSWLDAYKEFGSTTDAIKEKMQEMIDSLIVKSVLADAAKVVLKPFFDDLEKFTKDYDLTPQEVAALTTTLTGKVGELDSAMTSWMTVFQSLGIKTRGQLGSFTGIARDIASASEESILSLAAGINTQNFYMSSINTNVQQIVALMGGSTTTPTVTTAAAGEGPVMPSVQEMVYDHLPNIDRNIAELARLVSAVVKPTGTPASYYVATRM